MTTAVEQTSPADEQESEVLTPEELQVAPLIAKLREWNLEYRVEQQFPIAGIDVSGAAQVRAVSSIAPAQRVEEYRQQMANGALFPPVLLRETGGNPLLIDGNTRLAAARKNGRKTFPAVIVDTKTPEMALTLAAAVNQMGGERLTPAEAHEAALRMMRQGFPDQAIGRELGKDISQVRRWRAQQDVIERADALGLKNKVDLLSAGTIGQLGSIRHDAPFAELTKLFADIRPKEKDAKEYVQTVNETASDDAALAVIEALREDLAPAGPPPHVQTKGRSPIPLIRAAIGNLVKFAGKPQEAFDPAKRTEELEKWQKLRQVCDEVLEALQRD
jgi:ParB-like chromosome segregation protein Spo0J